MDGIVTEELDERAVAIRAAKTKRKKALTCKKLSMDYLKAQGYSLVVDVEKRIPGTVITQDLFGFIDILALRRDEVLGVQATSHTGGKVAEHIRKITDHKNLGAVREAGIRIVVHGWKRSKTGPVLARVEDLS